jgi:phage gpG-like protein
MPVYKSFTAAIKDLMLPMDRAGEALVNSIKEIIFSNSVPGKELSEAWVRRKTQNKNTKLLHTGLLANSTKYAADKNSVSVGYDDKTSGHTSDGKGSMTNAGMAEVHNEGNSSGLYNIPARPFLFIGYKWHQKHETTIQNFIQNYYKSKGII